nr:MAG TPA: hypothetical protein [Caudoviricetes sp.]
MKQNIDLLHSLSESQLKTPTALTSKRVRAFFLYVNMRSILETCRTVAISTQRKLTPSVKKISV